MYSQSDMHRISYYYTTTVHGVQYTTGQPRTTPLGPIAPQQHNSPQCEIPRKRPSTYRIRLRSPPLDTRERHPHVTTCVASQTGCCKGNKQHVHGYPRCHRSAAGLSQRVRDSGRRWFVTTCGDMAVGDKRETPGARPTRARGAMTSRCSLLARKVALASCYLLLRVFLSMAR